MKNSIVRAEKRTITAIVKMLVVERGGLELSRYTYPLGRRYHPT